MWSENRYTELTYGYENDKVNELSITGTDEKLMESMDSYKQHFLIRFNSDKKLVMCF